MSRHFYTEFANIKALAWFNLGWDAADVKRAMEKLSTVALPRISRPQISQLLQRRGLSPGRLRDGQQQEPPYPDGQEE